MTDQVKKLAPEIWQIIQVSPRILSHCHPNPDPDSVGSALALAHALRSLGKEVTVIQGDSPFDFAPGIFPGLDTIVPKNWFELDLNQFDLFIALDVSNRNRVSTKGEVIFPPTLKTIIIDHHTGGEAFGDVNLIEPSYPATAQILFDLFKCWQINLTHDIALNLFVGIYTDTGGFKYRGATSETFQAAAELSSLAPDFPQAIFQMENNNSPEQIRLEGLALNNIGTFLNGRVALASVSLDQMKAKGIDPDHLTHVSIAAILRSVKGWEVTAFLREAASDEVRVSLRTRDAAKYNVGDIARGLGGGGHPAAAGVTIRAPLAEAKQQVLAAIKTATGFI